jgi:hypothetical protein
MNFQLNRIALAAAISLIALPGLARAFDDCPADHVADGYTCDEKLGAGKTGGFFRITFPSDWDGDLVIYNHGFDLNDKHIRPHETCSNDTTVHCEADTDCTGGAFCNNISYSGLDEILLPMGKAVAASTYSTSGWAPFKSAKDIKDILKYVKKDSGHGSELKRVIITGHSGGGAATVDAMLKLKIDGAVPMCPASGGGLPTWDVAMDVRLVYDFICNDVPGAKFASLPDQGEVNTNDSGSDAITMALKVDQCLGVVGFAPHTPEMDTRLADFISLTAFTGGSSNVATAMGFATLGLGDFVRDPNRLDGKLVGLNDAVDYSTIGVGGPLAASFQMDVERMTLGKGRKSLAKAYNPNFTKGKGSKITYPVLALAGDADWLVIPEFQSVFNTALSDGSIAFTQTWTDPFGHCVYTAEETTAVFNKFFEWLGPVDGDQGAQPTAADVAAECIAIGGVDGSTCNFNDSYVPGKLFDRIPARADWPAGATH